jgi:hypothetical protein
MGGKAKALPDGHPRRMSDGKNAWRKMTNEQRVEFLQWITDEYGTERGMAPGKWVEYDGPTYSDSVGMVQGIRYEREEE